MTAIQPNVSEPVSDELALVQAAKGGDVGSFEELVRRQCGDWSTGSPPRAVDEARPAGGVSVVHKPTSLQQHVMQMAPAPPAGSRLRFAADLLSVIVGDDTGSRMFWELVDPGYAETAEMGYNEFDGSGSYLGYFGSDPDQAEANIDRLRKIYDEVNRDGVGEVELAQARNKIASRIVLRSERPMGRLSSLGHNWLYRGEYRTVADDLETLRSITADEIRELLEAYPLRQTTTSSVGPLESLLGQSA